MKKICNNCQIEKNIDEFYNKKDTKDGHTSFCKKCININAEKYRNKNRIIIKDNIKKYYYLHKDAINKKRRDKNKLSPFKLKKLEKDKVIEKEKHQKILLINDFIKNKNIEINNLNNFILFNLLLIYNKNIGINGSKSKKEWFVNNGYEHYYNDILNKTNFLNVKNNISISERIYCVLHDIKNVEFCVSCQKNYKKYLNFNNGYNNSCPNRKCSVKLKSILKDENGLTATDRTTIGLKKYLNTIDENGITNSQKRTLKSLESKNKIGQDGLDSHERGFLNGAGKNSSIKYYNKDLYYQGTYEKHFLDFMTSNDIINNIKRGNRFIYFYNNKEHQYRSDFMYKNIIFEIKSSWTYGKKDQNKRILNHLKFKSVLNNNYKLIVIFDKKYFIEVCDDNISIDNLYELNMESLDKLINYIS